MKHFINRFTSWKLIVNNKLIKLDDKYDGKQFLLSELIESIEKIISDTIGMDFTSFIDRKSLVCMLRFVQEKEILKISEGSLEHVESNREKEILYENTGLSNYFSIHNDIDISSFANYKDFENIDDNYSDKEKGHIRTRLLLQPAMYWDSKDDADEIYNITKSKGQALHKTSRNTY